MLVERYKKWIFPCCLLVLLILLVSLRFNGSSAAIYKRIFYGTSQSDSNLIAGAPRQIRTDEYMVQTPWMISQVLTKSTGVNQNIGDGIEFSVQNIPVLNWTLLFRPLFWGFYILPLEYGFSLYWWGKAFLLVIASYLLALKLTGNKILVSIFLSIGFLFSPFFQWWYSTTAIELVAYASILLLLFLEIVDQKKTFRTAILTAGLIYFTFTLFLLLYPAFQLPVLYVALFAVIGYVIQNNVAFRHPDNQKKIAILLLSIIAIAGLCIAFYKDNQDAIDIVRNTLYPGKRFSSGGGINPIDFLKGFFNRQLLSDRRELLPGMMNQCEASSFFLLSIILAPWSIVEQIFSWSKTKKINKLLIFLIIIEIIFIAWSVVGFPRWLAKASFFYLSPPVRTTIGFGWVNFLVICVLLSDSQTTKVRIKYPALFYSIAWFFGFVALGFYFRSLNYDFLASRKLIVFIAFSVGLMVFLLIQRKSVLFSLALLLFSLWSSISVNPLYRGLGPYFDKEVSKVIQQREALPDQKWVVYGNITFPNYILANGGRIYNGTFFYPDMAYITKFDPENKYISIYNQYAHILFDLNDQNLSPEFKKIQGDVYTIKVNPCFPTFDELGINNFVFNKSVDFPCLEKYAEVHKPNISFYFYSNDLAN